MNSNFVDILSRLVPLYVTLPDLEQMKNSGEPWYGPSFYTHPQGYKMCLRVDANGNGDGENTRVCVCLHDERRT